MSVTADPVAPIVVANVRLISHDRAAFMLGLKPASFSSALSRGQLQLTRFRHGRGFVFNLDEVEKLILSRAVPPGQRVR